MSDGFTRTSLTTTGGPGRAPNRAMLRGVGFTDEDFAKPVVGIASLFSDITPCNAHLDRLARAGREGVRAGGGVPQVFGAPTASDGILMGHRGMRYSLVSREVIADSIEVVAGGMNHDGVQAFLAGKAVVECIARNLKPRDVITRRSLENAYTFVLALGGSTNAVLHLMAIAREAGVPWTLADFDRLGAKVPHLADLKPGGKYVMFDLHKAGGTPAVLRALLDAGFLHGDCVTITGKTLAENLADVPSVYARKQAVIRPLDRPLFETGHIVILHGNLAPD